jgi:O-antigen/teichoic acid export membrane protein
MLAALGNIAALPPDDDLFMTSVHNENSGFTSKSGALQLLLRYGLGFLINITGTIVIARATGPEFWGFFAVSQVALTVFGVLGHGCWGYVVQTPKAPNPDDIGNCHTFQAVVSTVWALMALAAMPIAARFISISMIFPLVLSAVIGGMFYGSRFVVCGLSERDLTYRVAALAELSDIIVFNIVVITLSYAGHTFWGIVAGNCLRGVISLIVALRASGQSLYFRYKRDTIGHIARFSMPFAGFIALQWLPIYAGPVVAGSFLGMREMGLLQLAYKTLEYPRVLVTIAFRFSTSLLSQKDIRYEHIGKKAQQVLDLLFYFLVPAMGLIVGLSRLWVPLVYGQAWQNRSYVMSIILYPYMILALMMILSSLLSSRGQVKASFRFYAIYNVLYWPSLIILTNVYGFYGAPTAEWIVLFCTMLTVKELRTISIPASIVLRNALLLFTVSGAIVLVQLASAHMTPLLAMLMVVMLMALWTFLSPGRKGLKQWTSS